MVEFRPYHKTFLMFARYEILIIYKTRPLKSSNKILAWSNGLIKKICF
jgi:hypothetical protein